MGNLKVNYQALEGVTIPELKKYESDLADTYDSMKSTVHSLTQYMSADSAISYANEFEKIVGPSIESMKELVKDYYTQLQQVASHFAEVDASMSSQIDA